MILQKLTLFLNTEIYGQTVSVSVLATQQSTSISKQYSKPPVNSTVQPGTSFSSAACRTEPQKQAEVCDQGNQQELCGSQGQPSSQGISNSQTKYSPEEIERKKQLALAKRKSRSQQVHK